MKLTLGLLFVFVFFESSFLFACDNNKQWVSPPSFEVDGYLDPSLDKMLKFIRLLKNKKIKGQLKIHQCIAISLFAEAYRLRGEPCSKRSLNYIKEWADYCSRSRWFDLDAYGFATCHILGITASMNFTPLSFDILFSKHPECIIRTVEEFRKKVTKEDIKKAILFIENPDFVVEPNAIDKIPDCEEIRNPGFWTKLLKYPKDPFKARRVHAFAKEASDKARNLFRKKCSLFQNGKEDAFRHCFWSCLITKKYGPKVAADYTDFHEFSVPNPCDEAIMDYKNNRVGISYGKTKQSCLDACLNSSDLEIIQEEKCLEIKN